MFDSCEFQISKPFSLTYTLWMVGCGKLSHFYKIEGSSLIGRTFSIGSHVNYRTGS